MSVKLPQKLPHGPGRPPSQELVAALEKAKAAALAIGEILGTPVEFEYEIIWLKNAHVVRVNSGAIWTISDDMVLRSAQEVAYLCAAWIFRRAIRGDHDPDHAHVGLVQRTARSVPAWTGGEHQGVPGRKVELTA
jgi:hypothetical protein